MVFRQRPQAERRSDGSRASGFHGRLSGWQHRSSRAGTCRTGTHPSPTRLGSSSRLPFRDPARWHDGRGPRPRHRTGLAGAAKEHRFNGSGGRLGCRCWVPAPQGNERPPRYRRFCHHSPVHRSYGAGWDHRRGTVVECCRRTCAGSDLATGRRSAASALRPRSRPGLVAGPEPLG